MTSCQSLMTPPHTDTRTAKLRFSPAVLESTPDDWSLFDKADRDLLTRLLRESVEYVDDPVFHKPGAEKSLFGRRALLAGNGTHFMEALSCHRKPRDTLSAAEEMLLFQQLNYARMRCWRLLWRFRQKSMPLDQLRLLLAWAHRHIDLRQRIVEANMPLVLSMMKRTRLTGLDTSDLVSAGNFALLRCVDKFNCSLGFKFSTYACRAILKSFARVRIQTSRYRGRFPVTLDPTIAPDDRPEQQHDEAESLCLEEVQRILGENRAELSVQEHTVICARFELGPNLPGLQAQTLERVGRLIGVTKERVRQIQNRALQKLRSALEDSLVRSPVLPGGAQP